MKVIKMKAIERHYTNGGQHAEQVARFTLTGEICKADNKPFTAGGDCGNIQIKSARATICHGTDIKAHIEMDAATEYGYVSADFSVMYLMNPSEYLEFAIEFGTTTTDSAKNGGQVKVRFKSEGKAMKAWFESRI
jgi:hypothetical protein